MFVKKYDNGTQMNEENCSFTYETSTSRTIKITNTISAISLEGNQYITDLRFPENNNIQVLFDFAFKDNINLKKIDLRNTKISKFGTGTFQGCSLQELYLPNTFNDLNGIRELWGMKSNQDSLIKIEVDQNDSIYSFDNAIYDKKNKSLEFASRKTTQLDNQVKIIRSKSFANLDTDQLVLPGSVQEIETDAFYGLTIDKIIFPQNFNNFISDCFSNSNVRKIQFIGRTKKDIISGINGIENCGIKEGTTIICGDQQTFQFGKIYIIKDDNTGITNKLMLNDHVYDGFPTSGEISSVIEKFNDNLPKKHEVYTIENGILTKITTLYQPEYEVLVDYEVSYGDNKWKTNSFGDEVVLEQTEYRLDQGYIKNRKYSAIVKNIGKVDIKIWGYPDCGITYVYELFILDQLVARKETTEYDIYIDPDSLLQLDFQYNDTHYIFNRDAITKIEQKYVNIHKGMNVDGIIKDGDHSFTDKSNNTIYVSVTNHIITYLSDKEPEYNPMTPASPDEVFVVTMASRSYNSNVLTNIEYDADSIEQIFRPYSNNIMKFKNANVTVKNLEDSVRSAISNPKCKLLVFHFSDHGSNDSSVFSVKNNQIYPNEQYTDENYSQKMLMGDRAQTHYSDNQFWNLIKNAKCRILCIFACCHAGSMFIGKNQNPADSTIPALISFCCCRSNEVSFYSNNGSGTKSGHNMILSMKQVLNKNNNLTYQNLWNKIINKPLALRNSIYVENGYRHTSSWKSYGPTPTLKTVGDQEKINQFLSMKIFT